MEPEAQPTPAPPWRGVVMDLQGSLPAIAQDWSNIVRFGKTTTRLLSAMPPHAGGGAARKLVGGMSRKKPLN